MKKAYKYDVEKSIRFRCLVGRTEAVLWTLIEPAPHGDEIGTHGHFHVVIRCPNIKVADIPEPDRCRITNETCPFIAPVGSSERNPESRKRGYAHTIIQSTALIEFYGSLLVNGVLGSKGLTPTQGNLRLAELARIMVLTDLVDTKTYEKLNEVRRIRNKLAHDPKQHLKLAERELFEWSWESMRLSDVIGKMLRNAGRKKRD